MARNALLRIGNIVRAEVEDVLGRIENPRKLVNQMLIDMERAFDQAVGEVSRAIANEKIIERRLKHAEEEVSRLQEEAEQAVDRGDDEAARRALDAKVALETTATELKRSHEEAQTASGNLKTQLGELRSKLESARNRKETVAARRHVARETGDAGRRVNRRPFDEFDRLVNQVDRDEIASEVYQELANISDKDPDLEKLERDRKVKAELDRLKRRTNQEQG
jgi:phage shock protein A